MAATAAETLDQTITLERAARDVQDLIVDETVLDRAELENRKRQIALASAGDPDAEQAVLGHVRLILAETGMGAALAGVSVDPAQEIFDRLYGLDVLGPLYRNPEVDEIRVNRHDQVYFQRRGVNHRADGIRFQDELQLENLIRRLIQYDGRSISRSEPVVESRRLDGTRITATVPPFSRHATLVLRKHGTFELTEESLIASGTVSERLLRLLATLVRGRANLLISGATDTGKTSLLRFLVRYLNPRLRIVTLENRFELNLDEHYPDRDIVALQEVEGRIDLQRAFRHVLRYTPNVIIVGEARGAEADEMVKACLRGHDGTMGTVHTSGVAEAVRGVARMIVIEGRKPVPLELQELEVAEAFDAVVQMRADPERTGRRMVERVTEVGVEGKRIVFRDLCRWVPSPHDWWDGSWIFPSGPSERLREKLHRFGVRWEDDA